MATVHAFRYRHRRRPRAGLKRATGRDTGAKLEKVRSHPSRGRDLSLRHLAGWLQLEVSDRSLLEAISFCEARQAALHRSLEDRLPTSEEDDL